MKIFIGGSKTIPAIDGVVKERLPSISEKCYDILVGDCRGIDTAVQEYLKEINYSEVTVYASGNKVRNNAGGFSVKNIPVADDIKGFEFYRKKDIAMANDADCGFMSRDGNSRGTLSNIIDLVNLKKRVEIYLTNGNTFHVIAANKLSRDEAIKALGSMVFDAFLMLLKILCKANHQKPL